MQITKDDDGWGPDWKPEYVELTEIVADDATGKTYRFDINEFIGDETVTYGDSYEVIVLGTAQQKGWQSVLEDLTSSSLLVKAEEGFVLEESVVQLLKDKGIVLKVEFVDGEQALGIYTIDGTQITTVEDITISKDLLEDSSQDVTEDGSSDATEDSSQEGTSPTTGDNVSAYVVILFAMAGVLLTRFAAKRRMMS